MGRNVCWGETSYLCFLTKKVGRNVFWGETSQEEMSWGEMSSGEKRPAPLEFNVERDQTVEIGLRESEIIYLEEKSGCVSSEPSFYDCFFPLLYAKDFSTCPEKCLPYSLPGLQYLN